MTIFLLYGTMQLSTLIFISGRVVNRISQNVLYFWCLLFIYYTFMFFCFMTIIKIAVRSWIPGLRDHASFYVDDV